MAESDLRLVRESGFSCNPASRGTMCTCIGGHEVYPHQGARGVPASGSMRCTLMREHEVYPHQGARGVPASRSTRCTLIRGHEVYLGRHSPNVSTILLRFFYDFSTIIPCAHLPSFPGKILVSSSKENPSPNLACTKFFYNFSTKSP
jgi:hypothetical protein